jgi:resuscitation-promoting factor RpfB
VRRVPQPEPEPVVQAFTTRIDVAIWDRLAQCESNGNWQMNSGNGYYGGLQFHPQTWWSVGGTGYPHQHTREEQIRRGEILQARSGWGQWPACSSRLGLR